jgi:hypothetical protein
MRKWGSRYDALSKRIVALIKRTAAQPWRLLGFH